MLGGFDQPKQRNPARRNFEVAFAVVRCGGVRDIVALDERLAVPVPM